MINVLQTGSQNVFKGICLNVLTMMKYTPTPIHLYILGMELYDEKYKNISQEEIDKLEKVMKSFNSENEVTFIDVTKDYEETFLNSPNNKCVYSPFALIRLFAARHLDCSKCIYLDTDTMTCTSLEEFEKIDLTGKTIGVTLDHLGHVWIKKDYINDGVMYMNLDEIRKTNAFEEAIQLLMKKKYYFPDQTAIYKVTKKNRLIIPKRYNEERQIKEDTVIKHFNKGIKFFPIFKIYNIKQYDVEKVHKELKITMFDDIYDQYNELFK